MPDFGKKRIKLGLNKIKTNGIDKPKDMKEKIINISNTFPVKAYITAVPIKGAVQGVASIVIKQPERKSSNFSDLIWCKDWFNLKGKENSNNPNKFNPNKITTNERINRK